MKSNSKVSGATSKHLLAALRATLIVGTGGLIVLVSALFNLASASPASAVAGDILDLTITVPAGGGSVSLPVTGTYTGLRVVWGDGTADTVTATTPVPHTYSAAGTYSLRILPPTTGSVGFGSIPGWTGAQYVTAVTYWSALTSLEGAFSHATNLTSVPNYIPASVTSAHYMFWHAESFNDPNVVSWNTSNITNMARMFADCPVFNQPINSWNVSAVTDMASMFVRDVAFNQDLNSWNTAQVQDMRYMFQNATVFNGNITSWDTRSVIWMDGMFAAENEGQYVTFNRNIGGWNTSHVTSMKSMFVRNTSFNQNLNSWDVSHVTDMSYMFQSATSFNGNITSWNTSAVTDMTAIFLGATSFNQPIGGWNMSHVTKTTFMFGSNPVFNQDLNLWDLHSVTDASYMFDHATSFNGRVDGWQLTSATTTDYMFRDATSFNQPVGNWNVSNISSFHAMFLRASSFNQPLATWTTTGATDFSRMFEGASSFNKPIGNWNTNLVTDMSQMFQDATAFNQAIGTWNTSNVVYTYEMFQNATSFNQPLALWNTANVQDMSYMFFGATSFNQPISNWNISSVQDKSFLLFGATSFNQSTGNWNLATTSPYHPITFNLGSGTGTSPNPDVWADSDTYNLPTAVNFSRAGYTFTGWSDGTSVYQPGALYPAVNHLVNFVAQWNANTLTVTVNPGNGSANSTFTTRTGQTISAAPATPRLEGYRFLGWFTAATGGSAITFPHAHPRTSDFTIYGQWAYIPLSKISFALNGGTGSLPSTMIMPVGSKLTLTGSMGLDRAGYTFTGWSDGTSFFADGAQITVSATDMILSPQWREAVTVPATPDKPSVTTNGTTATITVPASASNNSVTNAATTVVVTASNGQTCEIAPTQTSCKITGLALGNSYTFNAQAKNSLGTSAVSAASEQIALALPQLPVSEVSVKIALGQTSPTKAASADLTAFANALKSYGYLGKTTLTVNSFVHTPNGAALSKSYLAAAKKQLANVIAATGLQGQVGSIKTNLSPLPRTSKHQYDFVKLTIQVTAN